MTCLPASLVGICYVGRNTDDEMMSGEPSRVCVGRSRFWTHGHRYTYRICQSCRWWLGGGRADGMRLNWLAHGRWMDGWEERMKRLLCFEDLEWVG